MSDVDVTPPTGPETSADGPPTIVSTHKPPVVVSREPQPLGPPTPRRPRWLLRGALVGGVVFAIIIASTVLTRGTPPNGAGTLGWLEVAAPTGLRADAGMFEVTLRWIQPSGGPEVSGYDIYRDGAFQVHLDGTPTTFVDEEAVPAQRYEYEIEARSGRLSSDRASIHVQTSTPPLAMARLDGTYDVQAKTESNYGYSGYPEGRRFAFIFEPTCDAGACSTKVRIRDFEDLRTTLTRKGAAYEGFAMGRIGSRCEGAPRTSIVTIELEVARAEAVRGDWLATELVGTLSHVELPHFACSPSGGSMYVTVSLVL
jgi:hypothetical protein